MTIAALVRSDSEEVTFRKVTESQGDVPKVYRSESEIPKGTLYYKFIGPPNDWIAKWTKKD